MTKQFSNKPSPPLTTNGRYGFSVHTALLLVEVLNNKGTSALRIPIVQLDDLLRQTAIRCAELDDPTLNKLMLRLSLYTVADPMSEDYDPDLRADYLKAGGQTINSTDAEVNETPEPTSDEAKTAQGIASIIDRLSCGLTGRAIVNISHSGRTVSFTSLKLGKRFKVNVYEEIMK